MVHVAYLGAKMSIHSAQEAQMALMLAKEVSIPNKYTNFSGFFFKESGAVLLNLSGINKHATDPKRDKHPLYGPIYSLGPVELETLKTYIETNLANGFIQPFKFPTKAFILFV